MIRALKSADHHWWPRCVSKRWADTDGFVSRLQPNGTLLKDRPKNFGFIKNAHHIKAGDTPGEVTVWDHSFEDDFSEADNSFTDLINWLEALPHRQPSQMLETIGAFLPIATKDENIEKLVKCIASLVVRSPMTREALASAADHFVGKLNKHRRNGVIGMNMRHMYGTTVAAIGTGAKIAVLYSPSREFIFGDGFFHNILNPGNSHPLPKIAVPLTPNISVILVKPIRYSPTPHLCTRILKENEVHAFNDAIQVYAKNFLYYRKDRPDLLEAFAQGRHLRYSHPDNPIDSFIYTLPGIPPRDTWTPPITARS